MLRAALIGCGDVSVVHLEAIERIAGIELAAVCDTDPAALASAVARYHVPGFTEHRQLIEKIRPDVVHICTPHHQHADVAIDCLAAGVHVVLEKPLAHTIAEGDRLIEAAERSPAKIGVCFQNRYNATSQALRSLLDSGEVGQVVGGSATVMWQRSADYYLGKPWRGRWDTSGGGLLINQAIHTIDLLQWLVGEVDTVHGHAATHIFSDVIEVEDTAELVLTHRNGARSVFYATLGNPHTSPVTLEIVTTKATLYVRNDLTVTYADGRVDMVPERVAPSVGRTYWGISHGLLIQDFYDRLDDPSPFWISPREGQKSLRVLKEVYRQSGLPRS